MTPETEALYRSFDKPTLIQMAGALLLDRTLALESDNQVCVAFCDERLRLIERLLGPDMPTFRSTPR